MSSGEAGGLGLGAKLGALVIVLAAAGGAAGFVLGVGPFADSSGSASVSQVPADSDAVFYVDAAITDDPATKALVNRSLSARADDEYYDGPSSYEELREQARGNTSLDPSEVEEVLSFAKYPAENASPDAPSYWGVIVHADWSTEDVAAELKNKSTSRTWTESSYKGHTVYKSEPESEYRDPSWFAVLGDGQFVAGQPTAVKDAIDVDEGDADSLGGSVREAYDGLRDDALVAFAADVPRERIPEQSVERASQRAPVDYSVFTSIDLVSGAYYTSSDGLGVTVNMRATSADAAKDVNDVTQGGISFASGTVSNETVKQGLRDVEVSRDGSTVSVSYEKSVDQVTRLLAALERLGM
ncbi:hypothetical protein [Halorussus sp. AFM4]|uniref:hypothetical protein n=1 Tax=Halorussus sp. AFM4 TaxID=3421651 RepID=UPI003EBF0572